MTVGGEREAEGRVGREEKGGEEMGGRREKRERLGSLLRKLHVQ